MTETETRQATPPGPQGRRLVGNTYDYDKDRIGFIKRSLAEYGDVFSFSAATVFVHDPDLVHDLFNRTNTDFVAESAIFIDGLEADRLERDFGLWMGSRKVGFQAMTRAVVRAHGSRLSRDFDAAVDATGGEPFDLIPMLQDLSSNTVADFLFGPGAGEVVSAATDRSRLSLKYMASNLSVPKWLPLPSVRRAVRAENRVFSGIATRVDARTAHRHAEPEDMTDLLLADTHQGLTRESIIKVLATSMLASLGAPGTALAWLVVEMNRNEEILARLRAEAAEVLARHGTLEDDSPMTYTKAFVKEVLRLNPPTWLMGRRAKRDAPLGPWTIRKGQEIMFSPLLLHRDARWWDDPDELRPERWMAPMPATARRSYIPFGSGPRVCLGLHLALYQLTMAVARLAAFYDVRLELVEPQKELGALLLPGRLRATITRIGRPVHTDGGRASTAAATAAPVASSAATTTAGAAAARNPGQPAT
jgi:cytochrome P450